MNFMGRADAPGDWVKTYRSVRDNPIVGFLSEDGTARSVICETMAWIDLTMEAAWKDKIVNNKGRVVLIERGQLIGARDWLAKRWGWTVKKVRYFMEKLARHGMIQVAQPRPASVGMPAEMGPAKRPAKGNAINVVTICNYSIYQAASEIAVLMDGQQKGQLGASEGPESKKVRREEEDSESSLRSDSSPPAAPAAPHPSVWVDEGGQPRVANGKRQALEQILAGRADVEDALKAVAEKIDAQGDLWPSLVAQVGIYAASIKPKRGRKAKSQPGAYSTGFEAFWELYPRKEGKGNAHKAWQKYTLEERRQIYVSLKRQEPILRGRKEDPGGNFCAMPATWLNQRRFDDDLTSVKKSSAAAKFDAIYEGVL